MTATSALGATVAVVVLVGVLGFAVTRPRGLPEAVAAVPAALLVLVLGLVPLRDAWGELTGLAPTVGFLAAILALADQARGHGVFVWAGERMARASRGSAPRLLTAVFVVAAATTAVLSLDATVVLLTPVVLAAATAIRARPRPGVYASTHLANAASTLLPVSNLTNLLAFGAAGLSFAGFSALMALPWLVTVAAEYAVFRLFFRSDLATPVHPAPAEPGPPPVFALVVLGAALLGFAAAEPLGVPPAVVAVVAVLVLAARSLRHAPAATARTLLQAVNPVFLLFVLALGVVVLGVRLGPLGSGLGHLVPTRADLPGLLLAAGIAALAANVLNNLPATLVLVPVVAHSPALVLATLLGLNIGPNLTYVGSLATLLWRQVLHGHGRAPSTAVFVRLGIAAVPVTLALAVLALWVSVRIGGVR